MAHTVLFGRRMQNNNSGNEASTLATIDTNALRTVQGGNAIATPNMGGPKYSAAWWELVRSGQLGGKR